MVLYFCIPFDLNILHTRRHLIADPSLSISITSKLNCEEHSLLAMDERRKYQIKEKITIPMVEEKAPKYVSLAIELSTARSKWHLDCQIDEPALSGHSFVVTFQSCLSKYLPPSSSPIMGQ